MMNLPAGVASIGVYRTSIGGFRGLGRPARGPDLQLEQLIEKRSQQREHSDGAPTREALWLDSVKRYHAGRTEAFTWGWIAYHHNLARNHQDLADQHTERAEYLLELLRESA